MVALALIAGVLAIAGFVASIATWIALGIFSLAYLDNYVHWAPDWVNQHNFFGWATFTLTYWVGLWIFKRIFGLLNTLITMLGAGLFAGIGALFTPRRRRGAVVGGGIGLVLTGVALLAGWVVFSVFATGHFFDFTEQFPDLTAFLVSSNWVAVILIFLTIFGIVLPNSNSDN